MVKPLMTSCPSASTCSATFHHCRPADCAVDINVSTCGLIKSCRLQMHLLNTTAVCHTMQSHAAATPSLCCMQICFADGQKPIHMGNLKAFHFAKQHQIMQHKPVPTPTWQLSGDRLIFGHRLGLFGQLTWLCRLHLVLLDSELKLAGLYKKGPILIQALNLQINNATLWSLRMVTFAASAP